MYLREASIRIMFRNFVSIFRKAPRARLKKFLDRLSHAQRVPRAILTFFTIIL